MIWMLYKPNNFHFRPIGLLYTVPYTVFIQYVSTIYVFYKNNNFKGPYTKNYKLMDNGM